MFNDRIGRHPVVVLVDPDSRDIKVYLRRPGASISGVSVPAELRFTIDGAGRLIDVETGSVWSVARGIASEGPLKGAVLQRIPYVTAFDWA